MGWRRFVTFGGILLILSVVMMWLSVVAAGTQSPPLIYPFWVSTVATWSVPLALAIGNMLLGIGIILGGVSRAGWSRRSVVVGVALLVAYIPLMRLVSSVSLAAALPLWLVVAGRLAASFALASGTTLLAVGIVLARLHRT